MKDYYSGVFIEKGFRKSLISDIFRREFYRLPNNALERKDASLFEEMKELELWDEFSDKIGGRRRIEVVRQNEVFPLKSVVWWADSESNLLSKIIQDNPIKLLLIIIENDFKPSELILALDGNWVSHVEVYVNAKAASIAEDWEKFNDRFERIVFYNANENEVKKNVFYSENRLLEEGELNIKDDTYFIGNYELYPEAKFFNAGFFGKVIVRQNKFRLAGCSTWHQSTDYSEIKESLKKEFPEIWLSAKDNTDVCKDCEFRQVCVDNRIPKSRFEDDWYHPLECHYNPYIAKWKWESGYRTLAECGVKSDETGFEIDHERIAAINKELWGEL